jgi:uncharacterized glyoxalase superfamily protein PhnB
MEKQEEKKQIKISDEDRVKLQALEGAVISAKLMLADSVIALFSSMGRVQETQRSIKEAVNFIGKAAGIDENDGKKWNFDLREGTFTER